MILLIDWGNTYLKWMQIGSLNVNEIGKAKVSIADTPEALVAHLGAHFERILIASVRSDADNQILLALLENKSKQIVFAKTSHSACGIQCAYQEPSQLGIDRWLGVIAAVRCSPKIAIVSIGSAITLDVIIDGRHLGGQIIPGFRLLMDSLKQTGRVRAAELFSHQAEFNLGRSTTECVHAGINTLLGGYLEKILHETQQAYLIEHYIFTGGGGEFWSQQVSLGGRQIDYHPALVFEGLVRWFLAQQLN